VYRNYCKDIIVSGVLQFTRMFLSSAIVGQRWMVWNTFYLGRFFNFSLGLSKPRSESGDESALRQSKFKRAVLSMYAVMGIIQMITLRIWLLTGYQVIQRFSK